MDHIETLTRYTANFVDELAKSGLENIVISPGSRSTPLAMTFAEHPDINEWIVIDERSAAFFALGLAKQTGRPVAIICTSGTATANYFPAIVEAYYSRVPLIVLTADRPHELRDVGAPQAIEQIKLYGEYVKWFHEMALPEATPAMLQYVRSKASRAMYIAAAGNSGPVHLNFPFREPLVPNFSLDNLWGTETGSLQPLFIDGYKQLTEEQLNVFVNKLHAKKRGVIVCGPQYDIDTAKKIAQLGEKLGLPVLADPLSQIRSGEHDKTTIIEGYDAFLRNEEIRKQLEPDFIIRFGAMPVSKPFLFYMKEHPNAARYVIEPYAGFREPTTLPTEIIYTDVDWFCDALIHVSSGLQFDSNWFQKWEKMNQVAKKHLQLSQSDCLTEGDAVRIMLEEIPDKTTLYVGNSMAVRDVDTFFMTTSKQLKVLANRGANGIDGMISSGVGAAASGERVTLLLGDLSFFHDMNGLLAAKQYQLNITILLINNNGGGIFSFLPQAADEKHFDLLFGTPLELDFQYAANMYGAAYSLVTEDAALKDALKQSYHHPGLSIIEVQTERTENMQWHREKWLAIEQEILQETWS